MIQRFSNLLLTALLIPVLAGPAEAASAWTVEKGSRLGFIATQGGAPVEGVFERFTAAIDFTVNDLASSTVKVEIEIASVNSKSKDRDAAIISPGLFNASKWPTASFETKAFRRTGDGRFAADAVLTMRGNAKPVRLIFSLSIAPHPDDKAFLQARAKGQLQVQRLDYGIGQGPWKDTSVVGNTITILLDLIAKRKAN